MGVRKSPKAGFEQYMALAKKGYWRGAEAVAWCYWKGIGTAKDPARAVHWLIKYAKKIGDYSYHPNFLLLKCLRHIQPGSPEDVEAQKWLKKYAVSDETMIERLSQLNREKRPVRKKRVDWFLGRYIIEPKDDEFFEARERRRKRKKTTTMK
jgi:TPR repeat protein